MPPAALLLVLSTLAGPAPAAASAPPAPFALTASASPQRSGPQGLTGSRPHRFGLGGTIGVSNRGAAGAMRYWFGQREGIDFTAGYYRHRLTPTLTASSTQVMPSVLVMFTEPDPSRDVDVRPYAGGGVNYARLLSGTPATGAGTSATGGQIFGGVEMTFAEAESLAISAETGYYRQPVRLTSAPYADGVDFRIFVHMYLN
jgi:hypothetical protein